MLRLMFVILLTAASALAAQTVVPSPATPTGDAATGKKLFAGYGCYQCHGYAAQGGGAAGPRLAPRPIPFAAFSKYVRTPTGDMPPYTAKVVSEQNLADLYAFLTSIPQPAPIDSIPLLKP
jgi:mono/diheme cytochrome c family protein